MANILDEVLQHIPKSAQISSSCFEGANIILYTKNKEFLLNHHSIIRDIVNIIKKRVELRPDQSIVMELEQAENTIKKIIPEEAKVDNLIFDVQRSIVIIEAEKPGVAIGKQGEVLKEIKRQTLWVPTVKRTPSLRSKIIENIRSVLYQNNDYRKKFLHKVGQRIYGGWTKEKRSEWIRLTFLGGGRQVGRSCLYLQTPESKILLDCGINAAIPSGPDAYPHLDSPEFKLDELDAVIITHAHLDHSGCLPFLFKMGYRGPVYCTPPTRDIMALLALDFIGVSFKQAKKPIFEIDHVREMVKHTVTLEWGEVTDITPDIRLTLHNAGHVLGSSMAHLHIGNGLHNLLYTGDFKFLRSKLLDPADFRFPRLETVIMEATYGAKDNILKSRKATEEELLDAIKKTIDNGGKVLIPVLGVGRAQEVLLIIEEAVRTNRLKQISIFVQGMVWDITAIHTAYPDYLNNILRKQIFHKDHNPLLSPILRRVGSRKEQEHIVEQEGPCVIVATAGMLNAGASLEYFKRLADNPKNTLIFTSYLGENTIGRRVQQGEKNVQVNTGERPEVITVNMRILSFSALTNHAGRNELMRFVHSLQPRPKRIITNHGESSKCLDLASSIHKSLKIETTAPRNLESLRIR